MSTSSLPIMSNLPGVVPSLSKMLSEDGKWTLLNRILTLYTGIATLLNYVDTHGEKWKRPFNSKFNNFLDVLKKTSTLLPFGEISVAMAPSFQYSIWTSSCIERKWKIFDASWKSEILWMVIETVFLAIVIGASVLGAEYVIPKLNEYYSHPDLVKLPQPASDHLRPESIEALDIAKRKGVTKLKVVHLPNEIMEQAFLLTSMGLTTLTLFTNFSYLKVLNLALQVISLINIAKRYTLCAETTWTNLTLPITDHPNAKVTRIIVYQSIQLYGRYEKNELSMGARVLVDHNWTYTPVCELKKQIPRNLPAEIERDPISPDSITANQAIVNKLLPWVCDSKKAYEAHMIEITEEEEAKDVTLYIWNTNTRYPLYLKY